MYLAVIMEEKRRADIEGAVAEIVHDLAGNEEFEREGEAVEDGPKETEYHDHKSTPSACLKMVQTETDFFFFPIDGPGLPVVAAPAPSLSRSWPRPPIPPTFPPQN